MVSFFACFLQDNDYDGWKSGNEPPVKFAVRRGAAKIGTLDESKDYDWRAEAEWPPLRTKYQKLHLHPDQTIQAGKPSTKETLSYQGLM